MALNRCYVCQEVSDTRPYGVAGTDICYDCANATPERRATAEAAVTAVMKASLAISDANSIIITEHGIDPLMRDDIERIERGEHP